MSSAITVPDVVSVGVGFDTARYGHHVSFLRDDRQPAAKGFLFMESAAGYEQLRRALDELYHRYGPGTHFHVRLDAAGQYAANLERFLRSLPYPMTFSIGEPARNKEYRKAHFPKRKADAIESLACARFAVVEKPPATPETTAPCQALREVVSRLQAKVRQSARLVNQLHNLLARVFPELALVTNDLSARWVQHLLERYPTAEKIAHARLTSLAAIPYLTAEKAKAIQAAARQSVASLRGDVAAQLVRQLVGDLRHSQQGQVHLEKLMEQTYRALPASPHVHVESIAGIGVATAAVLVSKIVSIDRFQAPENLVGYFGVFPQEASSGVDKRGRPVPPGTMEMSSQGNDLVRKYLWMAALSAIGHNPAVRALYARLKARGKHSHVAFGHCMRKLLHQVFAVWKSGKPFDPNHRGTDREVVAATPNPSGPDQAETAQQETAGHNTQSRRARIAVTAAHSNVESPPGPCNSAPGKTKMGAAPGPQTVDFADLRRRVTMEQVLHHLGILHQMRGSRAQRRGPCPIHGDPGFRCCTFSVNLEKNVFQCFHPPCGAQGNVLDLWAAVHQLPLREAALHMKATFNL